MNTRINKTKKIGVIGCGYWGTIITKSLINLGYKNIYVFDSTFRNSLTLKKKFKQISIIKDYRQMLINPEIEFLFYATPPSKNFKLIKSALKYDKKI